MWSRPGGLNSAAAGGAGDELTASNIGVETNSPTDNSAPSAVYLWVGGEIVANVTMSYYYFQDARSNITHLTNANNVLIERYTYDLNGTVTILSTNNTQLSTSACGNRFLFAGAILLPETNLYDMRNRMYFPRWGRFIQTDPIGFQGDASNLYRYCGNDFVDRTDPTGLVASDTSRFLPDRMWQMACFF